MADTIARFIVGGVLAYFGLGLLFALPFVVFGVRRIDAGARHATVGFRLIIVPGSMALWPVLALRWLRPASQRLESNAHRRAAALASSADRTVAR